MSQNLAEKLVVSASHHPQHVAVQLEADRMTYTELDQASGRVAGFLHARGIEPGDRIGLMLPNVPEFVPVYYGILRAGAVVVPMNILLKEREVAFYLSDPEAKLVFAWHEFARPPRRRGRTTPAPSAGLCLRRRFAASCSASAELIGRSPRTATGQTRP